MSNEYKIGSLVDITKLEDDQIDRLCAELPAMLKHAKAFMGLLEAVAEATDIEDSICEMLSPLTWIDDGKQNLDIQIKDSNDEVVVSFSTEH